MAIKRIRIKGRGVRCYSTTKRRFVKCPGGRKLTRKATRRTGLKGRKCLRFKRVHVKGYNARRCAKFRK